MGKGLCSVVIGIPLCLTKAAMQMVVEAICGDAAVPMLRTMALSAFILWSVTQAHHLAPSACIIICIMERAEKRLSLLGQHLVPGKVSEQAAGAPDGTSEGLEGAMSGLSLAPTSAGDAALQQELQLLLEHDSHAERQNMKDLIARHSELFTP